MRRTPPNTRHGSSIRGSQQGTPHDSPSNCGGCGCGSSRPHPLSFNDLIGKTCLHKIAPPVESFTKSMTKLDSNGINFKSWLKEANSNIYFLIGKTHYLNQPSNPSKLIHPDIDLAENAIDY
ncbi:hypothetical protein DFH28DRAFT_1176827 [Melampsora americana]|nr:hypothetical protein DFH28DRAFT_1176827 [Melampsora americana]